MKTGRLAYVYFLSTGLIAWFALIGQFYLIMQSDAATPGALVVRYFSYFTILTNLLVAICCSMLAFCPGSAPGRFFNKQQSLTAITIYILVVGLIYNLILRFIWNPTGLQMVVDELLHAVVPLLFLAGWLLFVNKNEISWINIWYWLLYPLIYICCVLLLGSASGFYPYPFIDVNKLGVYAVIRNSFGIAVLFILLSLLFVAAAKYLSRLELKKRQP